MNISHELHQLPLPEKPVLFPALGASRGTESVPLLAMTSAELNVRLSVLANSQRGIFCSAILSGKNASATLIIRSERFEAGKTYQFRLVRLESSRYGIVATEDTPAGQTWDGDAYDASARSWDAGRHDAFHY